ncbi:MAG TPA: hypothetical protein PK331_17540 [Gordonia sp. (in: high G+C Gram-positive bacteria)]|uniref:hypothetical protein n=1 Tax=unclassified Gordonia (in: high G+C Gram-positive bacteria) TaxID=2657482 RepID=UPI000FBABA5F|nr:MULTISPECIES: hypothetical protein [unclassified Gordonia (in: high G+C Gram-positive bacteria)]RUP35293.1 MAG: hypothetical protein EKK60_18180 [Gordonia sp. (in: high G+C Gram-positive bacteria)]HNP58976.1 hypothetical protein [Gordonia sp. (in: high G+C Gram-positive bacteria)]HRC52708.1 hypothetical protein [Gordonia sp. (in: high G+C Gram-positive bacteria)]
MKLPKIFAGVMVAGMALSVAACGGGNDDGLPPLGPVTSSVEASAPATGTGKYNLTGLTNPKVRPTVKTLNQMLDMALDPNVPNSEKTQLVEGSEKDPEVFNKLVQARKDNPDATYKIFPPVIPAGPRKATVKVQLKIGENPPAKAEAGIVFVDGRWKLAKDTVCPLLSANDVKTAMCVTTGTKSKPTG